MLMPLGMTIMTLRRRAVFPLMAILGVSPRLLGARPTWPFFVGWPDRKQRSLHWIFRINAPIGVISLIYAFLVYPRRPATPSESSLRSMLMMSPGLALFPLRVSSLPGPRARSHAQGLIPRLVGLVLVITSSVIRSSPKHPLLDLACP